MRFFVDCQLNGGQRVFFRQLATPLNSRSAQRQGPVQPGSGMQVEPQRRGSNAHRPVQPSVQLQVVFLSTGPELSSSTGTVVNEKTHL